MARFSSADAAVAVPSADCTLPCTTLVVVAGGTLIVRVIRTLAGATSTATCDKLTPTASAVFCRS